MPASQLASKAAPCIFELIGIIGHLNPFLPVFYPVFLRKMVVYRCLQKSLYKSRTCIRRRILGDWRYSSVLHFSTQPGRVPYFPCMASIVLQVALILSGSFPTETSHVNSLCSS